MKTATAGQQSGLIDLKSEVCEKLKLNGPSGVGPTIEERKRLCFHTQRNKSKKQKKTHLLSLTSNFVFTHAQYDRTIRTLQLSGSLTSQKKEKKNKDTKAKKDLFNPIKGFGIPNPDPGIPNPSPPLIDIISSLVLSPNELVISIRCVI